ncbi:MAG TPA: MBL fold metallo-hydrolase, partial [Myxococcota bacterium]
VRVSVLGSGSKGNCLVVEGGGVVVMIDTGFSPRETRARMRHLDIDLADLDAILVTHAHGDHVKSVKQLAGSLNIKTFATDATRRFASTFTSFANHVVVDPGVRFSVGGLTILPIKTCHDEPGSVAYAIDDGDEAFAICTDLGDPSVAVGTGLRDVDTLMLEFNHDATMLKNGPYHARLKRRVASKYGHLNNDLAAELLGHAVTPNLSRVLCAHLSEVNNTNEKALAAARRIVDGRDVDVAVAPQHAPTHWLRVRRRPGVTGRVVSTSSERPTPQAVLEDRVEVVNVVRDGERAQRDVNAPKSSSSNASSNTSSNASSNASSKVGPLPSRDGRSSTAASNASSNAAPPTTNAPPTVNPAVVALREAVTRRQLALFAGPPTPTPSTTSKIVSTLVSAGPARERR